MQKRISFFSFHISKFTVILLCAFYLFLWIFYTKPFPDRDSINLFYFPFIRFLESWDLVKDLPLSSRIDLAGFNNSYPLGNVLISLLFSLPVLRDFSLEFPWIISFFLLVPLSSLCFLDSKRRLSSLGFLVLFFSPFIQISIKSYSLHGFNIIFFLAGYFWYLQWLEKEDNLSMYMSSFLFFFSIITKHLGLFLVLNLLFFVLIFLYFNGYYFPSSNSKKIFFIPWMALKNRMTLFKVFPILIAILFSFPFYNFYGFYRYFLETANHNHVLSVFELVLYILVIIFFAGCFLSFFFLLHRRMFDASESGAVFKSDFSGSGIDKNSFLDEKKGCVKIVTGDFFSSLLPLDAIKLYVFFIIFSFLVVLDTPESGWIATVFPAIFLIFHIFIFIFVNYFLICKKSSKFSVYFSFFISLNLTFIFNLEIGKVYYIFFMPSLIILYEFLICHNSYKFHSIFVKKTKKLKLFFLLNLQLFLLFFHIMISNFFPSFLYLFSQEFPLYIFPLMAFNSSYSNPLSWEKCEIGFARASILHELKKFDFQRRAVFMPMRSFHYYTSLALEFPRSLDEISLGFYGIYRLSNPLKETILSQWNLFGEEIFSNWLKVGYFPVLLTGKDRVGIWYDPQKAQQRPVNLDSSDSVLESIGHLYIDWLEKKNLLHRFYRKVEISSVWDLKLWIHQEIGYKSIVKKKMRNKDHQDFLHRIEEIKRRKEQLVWQKEEDLLSGMKKERAGKLFLQAAKKMNEWKFEEAKEILMKARDLDPENPEILKDLLVIEDSLKEK